MGGKIQFETLVEMSGNDRAFLRLLCMVLLKETPKQLTALRVAFFSRDWEKLYHSAHKLQATAGVLGQQKERSLLMTIPRMGTRNQVLLGNTVDAVAANLSQVLEELRQFAGIDKV